jgi:LacI family transcriptional regulator
MATIKDVAVRAGVSLGTVSNVLSGLPTVTPDLKKRVQTAIRELGYRPNHVARSLKTRQTHMLGMVVSDITNPFFPELVRGAEDAAMESGYVLTTFNTDDHLEREKHVFELLQSRQVDGLLVVVALQRGDHSHLKRAMSAGVPIVCLDRIPKGVSVDSVTVDNVRAAENCTQHLIDIGHRRIAYIGGRSGMYIAGERLRGYRKAMEKAGLPLIEREGDFRLDSGRQIGHELLFGPDKPTAVFIGNLLMTLGVLKAISESGLRIPEDVAIATFDYYPWIDGFHPRLTAVIQPGYDIGYRAARLLIDRLEGKRTEPPVKLQLETKLRIAESTVPAPATAVVLPPVRRNRRA